MGVLAVSVSSEVRSTRLLGGSAALCGFLAATGVGVGFGWRAAPRSGALWPFSGAMLVTGMMCLVTLCVARRLGGLSDAQYLSLLLMAFGVMLLLRAARGRREQA